MIGGTLLTMLLLLWGVSGWLELSSTEVPVVCVSSVTIPGIGRLVVTGAAADTVCVKQSYNL